MTRLNDTALRGLPADVARPAYDRASVKTGVVHLGIGAFHRAHQAVVFDDALASGDLRWGVLGASLRSPGVREQLNPQDGLYTLVVRDGAQEHLRVIGAGRGVLVGPEDPAALVAAMADADVHIVTLTVTEKGYRLDPATGDLLLGDPDVAVDLADISAPCTAPGFIVAALQARKAAGLRPFTVISCDNIPRNGQRIRAGVLAMARRIAPSLADWIEAEGAFPQTMIDRIVPATTPDDVARLTARLGVEDQGMVKAEPFTQWVIEDWFAGERPDFAAFGVQLTDAVEPWEDAKLRLLNGAHAATAYLDGFFHIDPVGIQAASRIGGLVYDPAAVDGAVAGAVAGYGSAQARRRLRFGLAKAVAGLPAGDWRLDGALDAAEETEAALAWLLSGYRFDRYRPGRKPANSAACWRSPRAVKK